MSEFTHALGKEAQQVSRANIQDMMEHGPGLRCTTRSFAISKDTKNKQILLGGLGGMGIGWMWFPLSPSHKDTPGYDEAPDIDAGPPLNLDDYETITIDLE